MQERIMEILRPYMGKGSHYIYFISDGENVKIGYAKKTYNALYILRRGSGSRELTLLAEFETQDKRASMEAEWQLHHIFFHDHVGGEWFDILDKVDWNALRKIGNQFTLPTKTAVKNKSVRDVLNGYLTSANLTDKTKKDFEKVGRYLAPVYKRPFEDVGEEEYQSIIDSMGKGLTYRQRYATLLGNMADYAIANGIEAKRLRGRIETGR